MAYRVRTRDEHWAADGQPKRILALDGGGIRGILTLGILKRIEDLLRARHGGDAGFRLAHYFDLIAGTSTGSIIAAALAKGMSVDEIRAYYLDLGNGVFQSSPLRKGLLRAKYDAATLSRHLKRILGDTVTLGGPELKTGLLVMLKRLDTGSPWPLANNPKDAYYVGKPSTGRIANADYPLWKVVRASTAAPHFFDPESLTIIRQTGNKAVSGNFVDGGVSPHNNPSLQALMYTTLAGFGVKWPLGSESLQLTSVGTGRRDSEVGPTWITGKHAVQSVLSIMDDCADLVETMLQWVSTSRTARKIDRAIGNLSGDLLAGKELVSYSRYNVELTQEQVDALLGRAIPAKEVEKLSVMDAPGNLQLLDELGIAAGKAGVHPDDFGKKFDLPPA